jgi:hypothetical protein
MSKWKEFKSLVTAADVPTQAVTSAPAAESAEPAVLSVPAETPAVLDDDSRPADATEEARTDLPQRSIRRIAFLLKTYEAADPTGQRTRDRIQNDKIRHLMAKPAPKSTDRKPDRNPQSHIVADPTAPVSSTGVWHV